MTIINFKSEERCSEIFIIMDNVLYIKAKSEGGYIIFFRDKAELHLTWKEFQSFEKALQKI